MVIYVDIDLTICKSSSMNYSDAIPIIGNIQKINKLYDMGHTINYWTARGATTGKNLEDVTIQQLKQWGVKYNNIFFNKPYYDIIIDDKTLKIEDI